MTEEQRFAEFVNTFADRASAAEKLEISESYLFLLLAGKRPINDKFRAKWRRAGGQPDDAISEQVDEKMAAHAAKYFSQDNKPVVVP